MAKKNQHVVPNGKNWSVKTAGSSRASSTHSTQAKAISQARSNAIKHGSEMLVHGTNGQIRERNTYGKDPYPPKG